MATIKTPGAGVSPYETPTTAPTVLRAGADGSTTLAGLAAAAAAAGSDTSVYVTGQAALNSLITTSQPGVFEGANVTINLEEQNFNTTNQVTATTNYPSGNTGEIQFSSGANSFASDPYFTYANSNVITPGIRTDGYYYANGAPFAGGGSGNVSIATDSTPGIMALGNGFSLNSSNQVSTANLYSTNLTQPTQHYGFSLDTNGVLHLPDQSIINGSTLRGVAGTGELNYTGITIGPNSGNPENTWMWVDASNAYVATDYGNVGKTWTFDSTGNLNLPGNTFAVKYADGTPVSLSGLTVVPNDVTYQTGSLYGNTNAGFTVVTTQDDDASYNVPIDFPIEFLGNAYTNGNVYLVSNSYLTFGSGLFENYIPVGPGVVSVPAIFVGATDLSNQKYYYGYADGTDVYVIGYEGSNDTYGETGYPNITWEMQVNSATPDQIKIVTNLTAQQPGGVWGVSNGAEWVDQFHPLPWFSSYADSTFNSVLIAPVTPQAATNIAFTGPGVTIGQDSGTTYVNIDPFDSVISVGAVGGEGGSASLSSVYEDLILTTPTDGSGIYVVPQGAVYIKGGNASSTHPGSGYDVSLVGGNAHDNPNTPGNDYGGGNITLLTGSAVGNSRPGQISFGVGNYLWFLDPTGGTRFPNLTVERGDNPSGTIQGQTLLFSDPTAEAIITTPNGPNVTFPNSQRLVINPGAGAANTAGEGGDIYLWAGRGGDASGSGGDIKIRGGQGGANTAGGVGGAGGYIRIEAGDAPYYNTGTGAAAGYIEMTAGAGGENQIGGYVRILGGTGSDGNYPGLQGGGDANIQGGTGRVNAPGGNVNLVGGISANGLADYGRVNISSGASTWNFNNTGALIFPSGAEITTDIGGAAVFEHEGGVTIAETNGSSLVYNSSIELYDNAIHIGTDQQGAGYNWQFTQDGNLIMPGGSGNITGADYVSANVFTAPGNVTVTANISNWIFGTDGSLQVPSNAVNFIPGTIAAANGYPTLLAYGSGGGFGIHGGPELDWMNADDPANNFGNVNVLRNTMYLNGGGLYIGMNENSVVGNTIASWLFTPGGNLTLPNGAVIKDNTGNSVSFGKTAGNTGQGISSVAIGYGAGLTNQGNQSVAIGENAGANQGSTAVAIGQNAGGGVALQGDDAVAIGHSAGQEDQGTQAIAIGLYAGETTQGLNSIALGALAGQSAQGNNSIILNATGAAVNQLTANTFTVAPVRASTLNNYSLDTGNVLYYNTNTHEVTTAPLNNITGDPYAAFASSTANVTVWTASSDQIVGAKLTVQVVYFDASWQNTEMLDITAVKTYPAGTPAFTVSNRVKTNPAYQNVPIDVTLTVGNVMQVISSAPDGVGNSVYWTYSATSFNQTFD